jgi:hypothetical protein
MSYRELNMHEIKEVLRRWKARQSKREIARATGLDRKTVRRYIQAAQQCRLSRDGELSDSEVHQVAQRVHDRPEPSRSEQRELLVKHKEMIEGWLKGDKPRADGTQITQISFWYRFFFTSRLNFAVHRCLHKSTSTTILFAFLRPVPSGRVCLR